MIRKLTGTVHVLEPGSIALDVGGVGYHVNLSAGSQAKIEKQKGKKVSLWTHLAVRENAMDLYGFVDREELGLFELLIDVPGIGPKSALSILSLVTPETLRQSIAQGDTTYLTKVSGIGKKTAEKVVLELKDKLGKETSGPDLSKETDAVAALRSLGYTREESREALKNVPDEVEDTGERVKKALKNLSSS